MSANIDTFFCCLKRIPTGTDHAGFGEKAVKSQAALQELVGTLREAYGPRFVGIMVRPYWVGFLTCLRAAPETIIGEAARRLYIFALMSDMHECEYDDQHMVIVGDCAAHLFDVWESFASTEKRDHQVIVWRKRNRPFSVTVISGLDSVTQRINIPWIRS